MATRKKPSTGKGESQPKPLSESTKRKKAATLKKRRFAEEFVANGGNATKAAQSVGAPEAGASVTGHRMLRDAKTQDYIREFSDEMREYAVLRSVDVLGLLGSHLRIDPAEFLDGHGRFAVTKARDGGKTRWIKRLRVRERQIPVPEGEPEILEITHEIEFHDAQRAAIQLCKVFGLEQSPRQNERDQVEAAIKGYMRDANCTRAEALEQLSAVSPIVAKYASEIE